MVSTKSQVNGHDHDDAAHPAVTGLTRLITDIDRLVLDIGNAKNDYVRGKSNGRAQAVALDSTISMLREHAHTFVKSLGHAETSRDRVPPPFMQLVVDLSQARTLRSMADAVGNYCKKAFFSPTGMIFVTHGSDLQLLSQWPPRESLQPHAVVERIKNGPVARALRTRKPVFLDGEQISRSDASGFLRRLLRQRRYQGVTFLPISGPQEAPTGVLALFHTRRRSLSATASDELVRFGYLVSGWLEHARAYEDALAARATVENALQTKNEFLSMLSHELRNPMMPILGWAVALSSGPLPADKQNIALEGIIRNVRSLNYLIEDLFDAVRISSGKLRLRMAETRLQDIVREALAAIQPTIESKKLRVSTDISEAIPPFLADSRRLLQVLMNLLNNAVKFTPSGGAVAIKVRRLSDTLECVVSDTGRGIHRKFLPFVFDRLRQASQSWNGHTAGLGLGLAIVREIVELHGGTIEAFSSGPDKGSTFVFRLPIRKRHSKAALKPPGVFPVRLRKNSFGRTQ